MRRLPATLLVSALVPVVLVVPTLTKPRAVPHPVAPEIHTLALAGVDAAALGSSAGARSTATALASRSTPQSLSRSMSQSVSRPAVLTAERSTEKFSLVGVTWDVAGAPTGVSVTLRTRHDGQWTDWASLDPIGTRDSATHSRRTGTEPYFVGDSDGVQVRVDTSSGRPPAGLSVDLVDPGTSDADATVGSAPPGASAEASTGAPTIYTRAQWGAQESRRNGGPTYMRTIKAGVVHHDAGTNNYSRSQVPSIIRGVYAYHTGSLGWSDIAYNFVVDKFGRAWEGRAGGMTRAVKSAATAGFNNKTVAVSVLGNYETAAPTTGAVNAVGRVMGWKLGLFYRNPKGYTTLTSDGKYGTSRYSAGTKVRRPVIFGHRDVGYTACPGRNLYPKLKAIRNTAASFLGAALVSPSIGTAYAASSTTPPMRAEAGVLRTQSWRVEVRGACSSAVVRRYSGTAAPGRPIDARWDLRDSRGFRVRPGPYSVTLTSWTSSATARSYRRTYTVRSYDPVPPVRTGTPPAYAPSGFVAVRPVRILATPRGLGTGGSTLGLGRHDRLDLKVLGVGGVPTSGVTAVALVVGGECPTARSRLNAYPAGRRPIKLRNVSTRRFATVRQAVVAPVGVGGRVSIGNSSGDVAVYADVYGYWTRSASAPRYHPVSASRIYHSRLSGGAFGPRETRAVQVVGKGGVPADATAVVVDVDAIGPTRSGLFSVRPDGTSGPGYSVVNFGAGLPTRGRIVVKLPDNGRLAVRHHGGRTNVALDVVGYYSRADSGGLLMTPVRPGRLANTFTGYGVRRGALGAGSTVTFTAAGRGRVPTRARYVVLSVSGFGRSGSPKLKVWPYAGSRSSLSDIVLTGRRTASNLVVARVGGGGKVSVTNGAGRANVVADVFGYFS